MSVPFEKFKPRDVCLLRNPPPDELGGMNAMQESQIQVRWEPGDAKSVAEEVVPPSRATKLGASLPSWPAAFL